jgi:hypothetical protein
VGESEDEENEETEESVRGASKTRLDHLFFFFKDVFVREKVSGRVKFAESARRGRRAETIRRRTKETIIFFFFFFVIIIIIIIIIYGGENVFNVRGTLALQRCSYAFV